MNPSVLVLGRGVLANALARQIPAWWKVTQRSRTDGFDLGNPAVVQYYLQRARYDLIINAAGVIDESADPVRMIRANAVGPSLLLAFARCPVIHISTDCVFTPANGVQRHSSMDPDPDRDSLYSVTKAAGEFARSQLIVRTSFVGEHTRMWKAIEECAARNGTYLGWDTLWSGGYVDDVARVISNVAIADAMGSRVGVVHIARPKPIMKRRVAQLIAEHLGVQRELEVQPVKGPEDRILVPTAGYELGPFLGEAQQ